MLILLFARVLGWLPSSGFVHPADDFVGAVRHAFLPSLALGLGLMAHLTRMTRATMTGILQPGIHPRRPRQGPVGAHRRSGATRSPTPSGRSMTVAGLQVGYLFGSIIVIESLFNFTGMGWLTYQALLNRDIPLIQATVFIIAAVVMIVEPPRRPALHGDRPADAARMRRLLTPAGSWAAPSSLSCWRSPSLAPLVVPDDWATRMDMRPASPRPRSPIRSAPTSSAAT